MNAEERKGRIRRILVAVDASPPSLATLKEAIELASRLQAELLGIFVEDIQLLRMAGSPFAQEVGFSSGAVRQLDLQQMQLQLRAQAKQVRRRLSRLAKHSQVRWSFRVIRGEIDAELLSAASDVDLIILGRAGWSRKRQLGSTAQAMASQAPRPALIHESRIPLKPSILVLYDGTELGEKALVAAAELVRGQQGYLTVALIAEMEEEARNLQTEVALWLKARGMQARYRWMLEADEVKLKYLLRVEGECILVLPGGLAILQGERLTMLLNELKCPVMIVR
jgi:nucleotide-binding universal stress UspA family protein